MSKKVKESKLRTSIMSILDDYVEDVSGATQKAIDKTARATVKQLKSYRPDGAGAYGSWDTYLKNWTSTSDKDKYTMKSTIHNKKKYMLAHLLEKGHNKQGQPWAKPYVHIKIADDKAKRLIEDYLEEEIMKL